MEDLKRLPEHFWKSEASDSEVMLLLPLDSAFSKSCKGNKTTSLSSRLGKKVSSSQDRFYILSIHKTSVTCFLFFIIRTLNTAESFSSSSTCELDSSLLSVRTLASLDSKRKALNLALEI